MHEKKHTRVCILRYVYYCNLQVVMWILVRKNTASTHKLLNLDIWSFNVQNMTLGVDSFFSSGPNPDPPKEGILGEPSRNLNPSL